MRLRRLQLHNFKSFVDAEIRLDDSTVIAGANGSGKSVLADAIRFLYGHSDRHGRDFTWKSTAHRLDIESVLRDGLDSTEPVWVRGEFDDLDKRQSVQWAPLISGGRLAVGTVAGTVAVPGMATCLIFPEDFFDELVRRPGQEWSDWLGNVTVLHTNEERWIEWGEISQVINSGLLPGDDPEEFAPVPLDYQLVALPGPEVPFPGAGSLLLPLLRDSIVGELLAQYRQENSKDDPGFHAVSSAWRAVMEPYQQAIHKAIDDINSSLNTALPHYVEGVEQIEARTQDVLPTYIGFLESQIVDVTLWAQLEGDEAPDRPFAQLGAGTQRAAAFAALDLYRDPELWDPSSSVLMLIEEPEVGLHGAAQRRVAASFASLPTYGVQTVITTHSPIFLRAAPSQSLRITRARAAAHGGHTIISARDVQDAAKAIGCSPTDALLTNRFVVVEGPSDIEVFDSWARKNGRSFADAGAQLIDAKGIGAARLVTKILTLAYAGTEIVVVLDNGRDASKIRLELEAQFGERVAVVQLAKTEIEGYFTPDAVAAWLATQHAEVDVSNLAAALDNPSPKKALQRLLTDSLSVEYDGVAACRGIAHMTPEAQIPSELRELLTTLTA